MEMTEAISTWIDTIGPRLQWRTILHSTAFNSRSDMHHLRLPEAIIRYRLAGSGPKTLVLATDPPVVVEQYDQLIDLLKHDFRVIVFEVPGFGFSMPLSRFQFDFDKLNHLVVEFLRQLDFGPYILAFPCVAAYGAVDIAVRFPNLVSRIVLMQAPSWVEEIKWKRGRDRLGLLSRPIIGQLALQALKRRRAPRWFEAAVGRREMLSEFVETTDRAFAQGACFCLASAFQRYLTDTPPPLSIVTQPTLVIWGEADKSHRHTEKSSSKIYCPEAQEIRLRRAGHFAELEEPELFAQTLRTWVYGSRVDL